METKIKTSEDNNSVTLIDPDLFPSALSEQFSADYWQARGAITGSAQGRGTTWFFQHNQQEFVLRHYRRGGMVGQILNDEYVYLGKEKTRAYQEFHLLHTMHNALALPVPQPAAAHIKTSGLIYRADIITTRIQDAQSAVAILKNNALDMALWKKVGAIVRRFHDNNIYHHDLNANNILIDAKEKVWLIDFDRGRLMPRKQNNTSWKQSNIARLHRSLVKEQNRHETLHWSPESWNCLLEGYNGPN